MGTNRIRSTNNCTYIMRIFYFIKEEDEGIFSLISCNLQNIFDFHIGVSGDISDDTLMLSCGRHLIKTFLGQEVDDGTLFSRFTDDGLNRTILQSILNKKLIDGSSGAEGFRNDVSSFNNGIVFSHSKFPFSRPILTSSRIRSVSPFRYR